MAGRILESDVDIARVVREARRVAVLGIKTEQQADQPAYYVPKYLTSAGVEVVPIPVYYPEATEILGAKVFRKVADVPGDVDILDVFRRPKDIEQHLPDILAKKPKVVWFQLGIRNDAAAKTLADAGIDVIQDRCLLVEHRRYT